MRVSDAQPHLFARDLKSLDQDIVTKSILILSILIVRLPDWMACSETRD